MNAFASKSLSDNPKSAIQNRKWVGLSVFAFMLVAAGAVAMAQQPKKVPRIGYLSLGNPASESTRVDGIRLALRERGYIEGQNIAIEYRYAEGNSDRSPELATELVRLKVDIIVVVGGAGPIRSAKNATKTIPIGRLEPVEAGVVEGLVVPAAGAARARNS